YGIQLAPLCGAAAVGAYPPDPSASLPSAARGRARRELALHPGPYSALLSKARLPHRGFSGSGEVLRRGHHLATFLSTHRDGTGTSRRDIAQGSRMSRRLIIRADAGAHIGAGHVMRCLALAERWQQSGGDVTFLTKALSPPMQARLKALAVDWAEVR